MSDPRIQRLRSLDADATPGPWRHNGLLVRHGEHRPEVPVVAIICGLATTADPNADLIAAMRNAWPAVVTLVEHTLDVGCSHTTLARDAQAVLDSIGEQP